MAASGVSSADIGFEGFRLTREKPAAVAVWAGVLLLFSLVSAVIMVGLGGEAMNALASASEQTDPERLMASLAPLAGVYALLLPLSLILYAILYAAVHRAVLRPSEGGVGFLQLGGDELRQAAVLFVYFIMLFLAYVVAAIMATLLGGILAFVAPPLGAAVSIFGVFAAVAVVLWLGVRFSLASPLTLLNRKFEFGRSWSLTRGRFWPLFGGYVLALLFSILVFISGLIIYVAIAALIGGGMSAASVVFSPDFSSLGAYLTPAMILYVVVVAVLSALTTALMVGASSEACRQLTGASPDEMAATFA